MRLPRIAALGIVVIALGIGGAGHAQESSPAARAALAHQLYDASLAALSTGTGRPDDVYDWSVRWMRAELEQHATTATQAHFDRMNTLLARVHGLVAAGMATASAETECEYYVAEARAWMAQPPTVP
jgi:hypothetical protein